jgi:ketosteroid isomerase-like protein
MGMAETVADEVLAANLQFYLAFTNHDYAAMDALWAREAEVLCLHPGWTALHGRDAVMRSWRDILANPEAPHVACHDDQAFLYGDMAVVLCEEELSGGNLAASNIFIKEDGRWRLVHHQASPIVNRTAERRPRRPSR